MISLFKKIRLNSVQNKKLIRYTYYAIGEILLVTIGILIALQINNWNNQKIDIRKERSYLEEIKENLNDDLKNIESVISFDDSKIITIDSTYYFLSKMDEIPNYGRKFSSFMPILTEFSAFEPNNVAFNNMVSSGNIDLIRNDSLKKVISRYYTLKPFKNVQDQINETTTKFLEYTAQEIMNKELMYSAFELDFDIQSADEMEIHKDRKILSSLFIMQNKMRIQRKILRDHYKDVESLIQSINTYLK